MSEIENLIQKMDDLCYQFKKQGLDAETFAALSNELDETILKYIELRETPPNWLSYTSEMYLFS